MSLIILIVLMLIGSKNIQIQDMNSTRGESPDPRLIEYNIVPTSPQVCWSWSQIYFLYSDKYDDHKDDHDADGHDGEDEVSDRFPLLRDTFC